LGLGLKRTSLVSTHLLNALLPSSSLNRPRKLTSITYIMPTEELVTPGDFQGFEKNLIHFLAVSKKISPDFASQPRTKNIATSVDLQYYATYKVRPHPPIADEKQRGEGAMVHSLRVHLVGTTSQAQRSLPNPFAIIEQQALALLVSFAADPNRNTKRRGPFVVRRPHGETCVASVPETRFSVQSWLPLWIRLQWPLTFGRMVLWLTDT